MADFRQLAENLEPCGCLNGRAQLKSPGSIWGAPIPVQYKQELLANRGEKVRSRSTGAIQSCRANGHARLSSLEHLHPVLTNRKYFTIVFTWAVLQLAQAMKTVHSQ